MSLGKQLFLDSKFFFSIFFKTVKFRRANAVKYVMFTQTFALALTVRVVRNCLLDKCYNGSYTYLHESRKHS